MKKEKITGSELDERRLLSTNVTALIGGVLIILGSLLPREVTKYLRSIGELFLKWYYPVALAAFGVLISVLAYFAIKKKKDFSLIYGISAVIAAGYTYYIHAMTIGEMKKTFYPGLIEACTILAGAGAVLVFAAGFMSKKKSGLEFKQRLLKSRLKFLGLFAIGVIGTQILYYGYRVIKVSPAEFHGRAEVL